MRTIPQPAREARPSSSESTTQEVRATFERVAVVISIYKIARWWWDRVLSRPDSFTPAQKAEKMRDLEDAEGMIQALAEDIENLSAASRQQLFILYNEMHSHGMCSLCKVSYCCYKPHQSSTNAFTSGRNGKSWFPGLRQRGWAGATSLRSSLVTMATAVMESWSPRSVRLFYLPYSCSSALTRCFPCVIVTYSRQ